MKYSQALQLLNKYVKEENVKGHCKNVARIAEKVALAIQENGTDLDIEQIKCAALLHDIGRGIDHSNHEEESTNILKKEGYPKIAKIVKTHGIRYERFGREFEPRTLEQKIVAYADGRDNNGQTVSLEERFKLLESRRSSSYIKYLKKALPRALKNEKDLLKLANKNRFDL